MGKKKQSSNTTTNEEALHKNMLDQLGLKYDSHEGKVMLDELKKKSQKGKNDTNKDEGLKGATMLGDGKLTLGDLF